MKIISITYYRIKYFHLKLTNFQPRITYLMVSQMTYCILFGDIVYFEPKNIEYEKLVLIDLKYD